MRELVDFSLCRHLPNIYGGASRKRRIITTAFDGQPRRAMMKFGRQNASTKPGYQDSYTNAPINEDITCRIFQAAGIPTQQTILGAWRGHSVVACLDFTDNGRNLTLIPFGHLETSDMTDAMFTANRDYPELTDIESLIRNCDTLAPCRKDALIRFRQMVCVDALVGNFDRHTGNWGYLMDNATDAIIGPAPIYDCGSALMPRLGEPSSMQSLMTEPERLNKQMMRLPLTRMLVRDRQLTYGELLLVPDAASVRTELPGIMRRLSKSVTDRIIDDTAGISDTRRKFYKTIIDIRRQLILEPAYRLALDEQRERRANDPRLMVNDPTMDDAHTYR